MAGIPVVLKEPLYKALSTCDVFHSDNSLWNFFADERLRPWQNELRDASSRRERAENLVSSLIELRRQDGENVLVVFLRILTERYDREDERQLLFTTFADQLSWYIDVDRSRSVSVDTSREANPRSSSMLLIAEAEKILSCARSVARVKVQRYRDKKQAGQGTGTGWLIAPGLVVTCWHVVTGQSSADEPPVERADLALQLDNMLFTFDYTAVGKGLDYKVRELLFPSVEAYETDLDFALLSLEDRQNYPLSGYDYLRLDRDAPLTTQTMLYIIQHPFGQHQQLGWDTFERPSSSPNRIRYNTPTEKGTSGAPILSCLNWRVIGLHNGESQSTQLREGTLIEPILSDLQTKKPDLYYKIMAAHQSLPSPPTESQIQRGLSLIPEISINTTEKPPEEKRSSSSQRAHEALKRYLDEITQGLSTLQLLCKLFAPPGWSGWRKRTVQPDESKSVIEQLDALEKSMRKLGMFLEQLRSEFYTWRLSLLRNVHRFEEQLKDLRRLSTDFYAGSEPRDGIRKKVKNTRKDLNKIKTEIKSIIKDLDNVKSKEGIQSAEDQVS